MFDAEEVVKALVPGLKEWLMITAVGVTGSTNDDLKHAAASGAPEGTVLIAGAQTAGKGRLGRSFYSPDEAGLYMSVLLRPKTAAEAALAVTTAAGAAVSEAIDELCGVSSGIKWVNDIYIGGRKVCGILAESVISPDGSVDCTVLGIGINVADRGFHGEIRGKAGAISADISLRPVLAAKVLTRFFRYYDLFPAKTYMDEYRKRSVLPGETVEYELDGVRHTAVVEGIDDEARLIVRSDGVAATLSSGEVSVKKII